MKTRIKMVCAVCFFCVAFGVVVCIAKTVQPPAAQEPVKESPTLPKQETSVKIEGKTEAKIAEVNLPPDATPRLTVKEIRISGNNLIPTEKLLLDMPAAYNASRKPLKQVELTDLYDFSVLQDVINNPGQPREVSTRTIQGFTQYILSVYQSRNYAGVYVYVPAKALEGGKFKDDVLAVEVLEAKVGQIKVTYYDVNGLEVDKGRLRLDAFREWSPVWAGEVTNKKKLDDFLNLLNLNPDRRVYATVATGTEPNALTLKYDIYEARPWHYFIQVDNAGTKDRQWAPRAGVINTNLLGFDDRFTGVIQGTVDESPKHNYAAYASYEFPLFTPRLRLSIFGARSEFDVAAAQDIDFLGKGSFYGSTLRFNAFQKRGWFVDLLGSLRHEKSKVTPSLFPEILGSEVAINLLGIGLDIHRSDDISATSFTFNRSDSIGGSSQSKFWDPVTSTGARTNADRNFTILTFSAAHRQYIDANRIQRMLGSFTYIRPTSRLAPVEMTTFGGMYTVRGYEESGIVADGGVLWSVQYEYDLVKANELKEPKQEKTAVKKYQLRKLAAVGFFDWGRANVKSPVAGEKGTQYLYSIGPGLLAEVGEHFNAGFYYGFPLKETDETNVSDGRLNVNLMMRW